MRGLGATRLVNRTTIFAVMGSAILTWSFEYHAIKLLYSKYIAIAGRSRIVPRSWVNVRIIRTLVFVRCDAESSNVITQRRIELWSNAIDFRRIRQIRCHIAR